MGIALFGLLRKELVQFFRDRLILTLILWLYTIEVVICAVALSFDVSHLPLAVVDEHVCPQGGAVLTCHVAQQRDRLLLPLNMDVTNAVHAGA